ncbi:MAG: hypothetical protein C0402_13345 [Thermodesulfovibrio sp.]|nr:hypothetical protein [Thermodesulfovibrio sp.]
MTADQKAKIKADLAAKKPLAQIMKDAIAQGISVSELVSVLAKDGVDACAFVTAAVSGSSSGAGSKAVVSETITAAVKVSGSGSLTCIVQAAQNGGVSTSDILSAATAGGADADSVKALASASSAASTPDAPALGYSAPAPAAGPITYAPAASAPIGGGGGGAPVNPTKPASPTNPNLQRR